MEGVRLSARYYEITLDKGKVGADCGGVGQEECGLSDGEIVGIACGCLFASGVIYGYQKGKRKE